MLDTLAQMPVLPRAFLIYTGILDAPAQIRRLEATPAVTAGLRLQALLANATHEHRALAHLRAALAAAKGKAGKYREAERAAEEVGCVHARTRKEA